MTVIRSKSKRRRGLTPVSFAMLQRVAAMQQAAGTYVMPADIVPPGARRDWITLQSLLGRSLLTMCEDGRIRVSGAGWRRLRADHG